MIYTPLIRQLNRFITLMAAVLICNGLCGANTPNLIMILADDLGWKDTGFAGSSVVKTPNIDRLAAEGAVFTQAYASAPNCAPTRACLMSGQYTPRHKVYTVVDENHRPGMPGHKLLAAPSRAELATEVDTIAEVLKRKGYKTGMVGMWNLGKGRQGPCTPPGQGFDSYVQPKDLDFERDEYFNASGEYLTDRMTDSAINFIRENTDCPFFLYLAFHAVHEPFDPKKELLSKCKEEGLSDHQAAYAATIEAMDINIGRITAELTTKDLLKNTYIIFTSDNGGIHKYNAPLREGKGTLYEGGIRVPLCITGPGIKARQSINNPVSTIDLYATLADLAGAGHPQVDGISLVPLIRQGQPLTRTALFWHFPCYIGRGTPSSAIRVSDWKLIEFFETGSAELYNLADDPGEKNNLAGSNPLKKQELLQLLKTWQQQTEAPCPSAPNPGYDPSAARGRGRSRR